MRYYKLQFNQFINLNIDKVFDFFSNPENLEKITPSYLKFKIITKKPYDMREGIVFDYQLYLRGIPIKWKSLISHYNPPVGFIDEQIKGPYSYWHHTHTFTQKDEGTLITDTVKYSLPFGFIGRIAHYLWVKKDLEKIFNYRQQVIKEIFNDYSKEN